MKSVLAVIIAILAVWPSIIGATASKAGIIIAVILILAHEGFCRKCCCDSECEVEAPKGKARKRK